MTTSTKIASFAAVCLCGGAMTTLLVITRGTPLLTGLVLLLGTLVTVWVPLWVVPRVMHWLSQRTTIQEREHSTHQPKSDTPLNPETAQPPNEGSAAQRPSDRICELEAEREQLLRQLNDLGEAIEQGEVKCANLRAALGEVASIMRQFEGGGFLKAVSLMLKHQVFDRYNIDSETLPKTLIKLIEEK